MKAHQWNFVNADEQIIGNCITGSNDRKIAAKKLEFKFRDLSHFIRLDYVGIVDLDTPTTEKGKRFESVKQFQKDLRMTEFFAAGERIEILSENTGKGGYTVHNLDYTGANINQENSFVLYQTLIDNFLPLQA